MLLVYRLYPGGLLAVLVNIKKRNNRHIGGFLIIERVVHTMKTEASPIISEGNLDLTEDIVAQVQAKRCLFPQVVIALADQRVGQNPTLQRVETMRGLRDELNIRLGACAIQPQSDTIVTSI